MAPRQNEGETTVRDQHILSRLAKIEHKVDSIEQTTAFALRAESEKHIASVKEIFGRSKRRAQVYLAADGQRGVQEVAKHLEMRYQNVSRELQNLAQEGLLELVDVREGRNIYSKKPLDRTLRISRFLQEEFTLTGDGVAPENHKKKKRSS